jgi:sulfur relay (sulfurtransferase) DsrF/TusC family protein
MSPVLIVIASGLGAAARDGIDAALAAIAYEHRVAVLLTGDAVALLTPHQAPERHGLPDLARGLAALLHHGIESLSVSADCLRDRGITSTTVEAAALSRAGIAALIAGHRHVQRF